MSDHSEWSQRMRAALTKRRVAVAIAVVVLLVPAWFAISSFITWTRINRVESDPDAATQTLNSLLAEEEAGDQGTEDGDGPSDNTRPEPIPGTTTFLLVGTDDRSELDDLSNFGDFSGRRADVILLASVDANDQDIRLVSLPRDLVAPDLCGRAEDIRLADAFDACEGISASTMLQLTVEQLTSISVDHFATIGLEGFQRVVDELGGYEICVENPVRDVNSGLSLEEGCTNADGEQTLAWIRSRSTQELVDGRWRTMAGANDLLRNEREREFLVSMLERIIDATNVRQLQALAATIAPYVSIDDDLDLGRLVQTAWSMRLLVREDIETVAIPVTDDELRGMAVLRPTVEIEAYLRE